MRHPASADAWKAPRTSGTCCRACTRRRARSARCCRSGPGSRTWRPSMRRSPQRRRRIPIHCTARTRAQPRLGIARARQQRAVAPRYRARASRLRCPPTRLPAASRCKACEESGWGRSNWASPVVRRGEAKTLLAQHQPVSSPTSACQPESSTPRRSRPTCRVPQKHLPEYQPACLSLTEQAGGPEPRGGPGCRRGRPRSSRPRRPRGGTGCHSRGCWSSHPARLPRCPARGDVRRDGACLVAAGASTKCGHKGKYPQGRTQLVCWQ